jgi:hypothetical protein
MKIRLLGPAAGWAVAVVFLACGGGGEPEATSTPGATTGTPAASPLVDTRASPGSNTALPFASYGPGQTVVRIYRYAQAQLEVERALLHFTFVLDPGFDPVGGGCQAGQGCTAPPTRNPPASGPLVTEDLGPIVAALTAAGFGEGDISTSLEQSGSTTLAQLYVFVGDLARLDATVQGVYDASAATARVAVLDPPYVLRLMTEEECEAFRGRARDSAIEEARRDAEGVVRGQGVTVGEVLDVEESSALPPCAVYGEAGSNPGALPASFYEPGAALVESIAMSLAITFAVQ